MESKLGKVIFGVSVFGMTLIGNAFLHPVFGEGLGVGKVTGNYVNVRSEGSLSGSVITQVNRNETVTVLEKQGSWYKIKLPDGREGWIYADFLAVRSPLPTSREETRDANVGIVTGSYVNLRSEASLSGKVLRQLSKGTQVAVLEKENGWYKVRLSDGQEGWIYGQYLAVRNGSTASRGDVDRSLVDKLIDYAKSFLGTRYVYGGSSPRGFDCSGFVSYVFSNFGFSLPRTADEQANVGDLVSRDVLEKGDLVFFKTLGSSIINHVGIYIGDGQFIHASSGAGKVIISPLNEGYYLSHYVKAKRVIK
ncbi:C40 family peptidase [Caldanaerobacter sp.]|uniref:C40 family peptidase n=1 Tax=Caldanaerobacter sp. TaxID=2930036 RepID=UPI003C73C8E6